MCVIFLLQGNLNILCMFSTYALKSSFIYLTQIKKKVHLSSYKQTYLVFICNNYIIILSGVEERVIICGVKPNRGPSIIDSYFGSKG